MEKTYYRSIEELEAPSAAVEIDDGRSEVGRRDFLKLAGFSAAALTAAACQRPLASKAVPYLTTPEAIVPGRPYQLASVCHACPARCGILVTCRDGRPTKIEGNPDHPVSRGGVCAVGQAAVLGVYDSQRLAGPMVAGRKAPWDEVDRIVSERLATARRVRVVTSTLPSPTTNRVVDAFLKRFEDGRRVVYDVPSSSALREAHATRFGFDAIPHFDFSRADVIVSLDADFLGTWISPVEFTKQWSSRRTARGERPMSWHAQLEPRMSLTGSNADLRVRIDPRDTTRILEQIAAALGGDGGRASRPPLSGVSPDSRGHSPEAGGAPGWRGAAGETPGPRALDGVKLGPIVRKLSDARGRSLVVSGSNRLEDQLLAARINELLGSYGTTIDLATPSHQRQGSDRDLAAFLADAGSLDAVFFLGCNPVYDLPAGRELANELARVPLVATFASHVDETAKAAHVVCPDHHPLESWDDSEPVAGVYSVTQPAIAPILDTRSAIESFALWSGTPAKAYDLIRASFTGPWERALHDGFSKRVPNPSVPARSPAAGMADDAAAPVRPSPRSLGANEFALVLHPSHSMLDGRHAHNAWLHELPDPITKLTWDNCASLSPAAAARLGVVDGDLVRVGDVELPAFVQPGQHDSVVAIALGYGRIGTERFAKIGPQWLLGRTHLAAGDTVGRRVVHLSGRETVSVTGTGRKTALASTQLHSTMEGRAPVRELKLSSPRAGGEDHHPSGNGLWPAKAEGSRQWGLAIDLTRCTGCAACVISCQVENNVPVVGRDEVVRQREMHWIRVDRYYSGEGDEVGVVHQPVMCAHCGNAPCESVCPVLATVHSADGLNQQVYNRCVGTRYCANNCPYKARRFNWFDYPHEDRFANLVLNPDVTVRSRGVMEKCSMCAQRIEQGRIEAKLHGGPIADRAIRTACEQSCPADAIVFGNLADPKSRVAAARRDELHYVLLEELNVQPAVGYLTLVRNA